MNTEVYRYWYSAKQDRCMEDAPVELKVLMDVLAQKYGREPEYKNYIELPINGEVVEVRYTVCSRDPQYWPNWDDAVLLGSTEGFGKIRREEVKVGG
jgi:hypothetical protein